jgi:hypothetical protein
MATGSISDFLSSFNKELARPHHFDVSVALPPALSDYKKSERVLSLRCESTELPGRSLMTTSMKIYGVEEKFPYMSSYNDISLTFIVGDDMLEKKIFESWLNYIHPTATFNFKYKDDYARDMRITQYDLKKEKSYQVKLKNAYPIAVNPLSLDWGSDGYHKLTVTFVYDYWESDEQEKNKNNEVGEQNQAVIGLTRNRIISKGQTADVNTGAI